MNEDQLRPYFMEFGQIFELTIIRDKSTKIHRGEITSLLTWIFIIGCFLGCAFLTYVHKASAMVCIEALHDKIKLPNVR